MSEFLHFFYPSKFQNLKWILIMEKILPLTILSVSLEVRTLSEANTKLRNTWEPQPITQHDIDEAILPFITEIYAIKMLNVFNWCQVTGNYIHQYDNFDSYEAHFCEAQIWLKYLDIIKKTRYNTEHVWKTNVTKNEILRHFFETYPFC